MALPPLKSLSLPQRTAFHSAALPPLPCSALRCPSPNAPCSTVYFPNSSDSGNCGDGYWVDAGQWTRKEITTEGSHSC
ncbi:hypothetical protein EJB05_04124 [Eragrostis curvula]|uniref:Uncharacterized protein n=1 Tax=Eragrostis curvula TaxID=38414 RepID=A0A5J9W9V7_9POAL|nr:hypothetical protein EJB05_04124 [Eragrostis curvula]